MRNPLDPGWPERGERTESPEIAERWKWAYLERIRERHQRRVLGLGPAPGKLGPALERWLEHRQQATARATYSNSRTAAAHLRRALGSDVLTSHVEVADLQELVDELLAEGYQPSTLDTYRRQWAAFFSWLGPYDPATGVQLPNPGKTDVDTLSDAEISLVLHAARRVDAQRVQSFPSAVLACGIGLYMGLRQGEIFALSWEEVSESSRTVRVNRQLQKDSLVTSPLKGKLARTALVLPGWWERHDRNSIGLIAGRRGRHAGSRTQRNVITRVLDTAGLNRVGVGWHILRHTYARAFVEQGGRIQELQKSLGHSSIRTTEACYGHFHEDIAARLARERIYGS